MLPNVTDDVLNGSIHGPSVYTHWLVMAYDGNFDNAFIVHAATSEQVAYWIEQDLENLQDYQINSAVPIQYPTLIYSQNFKGSKVWMTTQDPSIRHFVVIDGRIVEAASGAWNPPDMESPNTESSD